MSASRPPLRFAIVGCGVISAAHARTISAMPDAEFAAAVDVDAVAARKLGAKYGVSHGTDLDACLDGVDAVAVCTPSGSHAEIAVPALAAGKHVVIEKPIDVTPAAVAQIADAARQSGRTAMVISQHRHMPVNRYVHDQARAGAFGRLTGGVATMAWWRGQGYYDSVGWRGTWALDGGGALMNQGIHTLDLLVWMLGQPVEVSAAAGTLAHDRIEVEDTLAMTIRFAGGALATLHATTAAYPGLTARVLIAGDRGSAIVEDDELRFFHAAAEVDEGTPYGGAVDQSTAVRVELQRTPVEDAVASLDGTNPAHYGDGHAAQYRDFLEAVDGGRDPLVTVAEGTRTVAVVWAAYQSARTGRPVPITPISA